MCNLLKCCIKQETCFMRKFFLSIPQPCDEDWNRMTQDEKGRFCNACQKHVMDFTNMTDGELAAFFRKPSKSLCGRLQYSQLERDIFIPRKRIPWIKYFFKFSLPAFLLSQKAIAQNKAVKGEVIEVFSKGVCDSSKMFQQELITKSNSFIRGKVIDERNEGIPYATVVIKGTARGVACDKEGNFIITIDSMPQTLAASCVGFAATEVQVKEFSNQVVLIRPQSQLQGEMIVTTGLLIRKQQKRIPLITRIIDTAFSRFSISPNPVPKNSTFVVNTKKIKKGKYLVSFIGIGGDILKTEDVLIEKKEQLLAFPSSFSTGAYVVRLTNQQNGKTYTEKLVIQ